MSNTSLLGSFGGQGDSSLMFRNRIINGDMRIDQRNAGAAVTLLVSENKHSADRWYVENATDGVASIRQVTTISGAVNFEANSAPDGFTHSIKWTVTTADATIGNAQSAFIQQRIEGLNCSDLGFGTASAKPITVSFWVKATATGTFGGSISNSAYSRGYAFSFTINSANTWEQKTVTIPGDTAGTWLYDNGVGLRLSIALAAGTDRSATPGSWVSSVAVGATGQTNFMASAVGSPSFYLAGVQLEAGPTATPFERRPIDLEERMCMRYAEKVLINGFSVAHGYDLSDARFPYIAPYKVRKRIVPTFSAISGASSTNNDGSATPTFTGIVASSSVDVASFYAAYSVQRSNLEHHWLNGIVIASAEL